MAALVAKKGQTPQMATALHLLKGAIASVLDTPITDNITYQGATRAKFSVVFTREQEPQPEEIEKIQALVNEFIAAKPSFVEEMLPREEAEKKYKDNKEFKTALYDRAGVRPQIQEIPVIVFKEPVWSVNACPGPHALVSELSNLQIVSHTYRKGKKHVEFAVQLGGDAPAAQGGKKNQQKKQTQKKAQVEHKKQEDPNKKIINEMIDELVKAGLEKEKAEAIVLPRVARIQNLSYTQGFSSKMTQQEEKKMFFGGR